MPNDRCEDMKRVWVRRTQPQIVHSHEEAGGIRCSSGMISDKDAQFR